MASLSIASSCSGVRSSCLAAFGISISSRAVVTIGRMSSVTSLNIDIRSRAGSGLNIRNVPGVAQWPSTSAGPRVRALQLAGGSALGGAGRGAPGPISGPGPGVASQVSESDVSAVVGVPRPLLGSRNLPRLESRSGSITLLDPEPIEPDRLLSAGLPGVPVICREVELEAVGFWILDRPPLRIPASKRSLSVWAISSHIRDNLLLGSRVCGRRMNAAFEYVASLVAD